MRANPSKQNHGWEKVLTSILDQHNQNQPEGLAIEQTSLERERILFRCFRTLHTLGFKVENPMTIDNRRIKILVRHWIRIGYSLNAIEQNLSALRVFCSWLGKRGLVMPAANYKPGVGSRERLGASAAAS